jgi:MFS family permease
MTSMSDSTPPPKLGPWYRGITRYQWTVLAIASLGWIFDVFEGQLYSVLKTPAVQGVLGPDAPEGQVRAIAGFTLTCFLAGGAVGGALFGVLGDRWGRRRVMVITILMYSVFTALTAFAQTWEQLAVLRFLVAMGVGGEWAVAAAVVAEVFPERARTAASGLFHASSGLGVFLAALAGMTVGAADWRAAFLLGLVPALLTLWIRAGLREPERWQHARETQGQEAGLGRFSDLWSHRDLRARTLAATGLATVGLAGLWAAAFWAPELAREVLKKTHGVNQEAELRRLASQAMLLMNCGNIAGLLCFAPLTGRVGRRGAFLAYHLLTVVMVPVTFLGAQSYTQVVVFLAILGFGAVGMHAGYAIYFPELFPTRLRATGAGFCFNAGRIVAAPGPWAMGLLSASVGGLRNAATLAGMVYLLGLVCLLFTPETRDKTLPD